MPGTTSPSGGGPRTAEVTILQGSCQSGAIAWQFDGLPESATASKCTLCGRHGRCGPNGYEGDSIRVSGRTTQYMRGNSIEFHFCPACGCVGWWRAQAAGQDGRRRTPANLRSTEPGPIARLPVDHLDGLDKFEDLPRDWRCFADLWV